MRICVVSYHSSPLEPVGEGKSGGMSIVLRSLYDRLAQHSEIDIFVRGKGLPENARHGMRVNAIDESDPRRFADEVAGRHSVKPYDLMHTHYWSSGVVGLHARPKMRIPWLHTMHTVEVLKTLRRDKTRIGVEEEIMRSCDLIVSPTLREASAIESLYPRVSTAVIPHGVDTRRFLPTLNGHSDILFVGRIDPLKGLHLLIDALRFVKRDICLTVAGGPSKGDRGLDSIRSHAAGLNVRFVGPVTHDRLAEHYSRTSMLVVPSYYESFGLVGLEAMASARPVVGFSHTGLSETVGDDAGVLVKFGVRDLARAIDGLASDHGLRHRLGRNGRRKALNFDWSNIAHRYERTYENIIEK